MATDNTWYTASMYGDTPEIQAAKLELQAAKLKLEAALLRSPSDVRGCQMDSCPGPMASSTGGCPMGYAGSCQRTNR